MVRSITDVATTWVYPYWHALCLLDSLPLIGGKSCASPSTLPANAPADGTLGVTADSLTALNAASLLIGGTRIDNADGTTNLVLTAQTISVANDVAHPLSAPEILLAVDALRHGPAASSLPIADELGRAWCREGVFQSV